MPSSLEEIERSYDEAIKRAGLNVEVAAQLKVERAEAVAKYRMDAILERERKIWQREALRDFPLAAEFPELVKGETEEEVRQAAQALHERMDKAFSAHQRQQRVNKLIEEHLAAEEAAKTSEGTAGDAAAG